jgi:predicted Zn-dependent protease
VFVELVSLELIAHAGRFNDAAAHLQYLLKDHPDRPEPAALYAAILRKQGQTGDAQGLIARAMQQDPKNMNFVLEAARIHYRAGNFAAARKHIENVLLAAPGNQEALYLEQAIQGARRRERIPRRRCGIIPRM